MAGRLVLIGASGALGGATLDAAREAGLPVVATYGSRPIAGGVRFGAESDALARLGVARGDTVILFAAHSDQEWVRTHAAQARALNVAATVRLASEARGAGARFVFLSSEAVFGKERSEGWPESAPPCPATEYGRQKAEAERALLDMDHACVVRTGWNVTARIADRCVVRSTYESLLAGTARLAQDNVFSLTDATDTARLLLAVCDRGAAGIVHAVSGRPVSRTALADETIRLSKKGSRMRYERIHFADLRLAEPKPASAWLAATRDHHLRAPGFLPPEAVIARKVALLDEVALGD